jgi:3-deoxy-D-manno-octulosonic-acid transferase
LLRAGAARAAEDARDLGRAVTEWLRDAGSRRQAGANARGVVDAERGAAARTTAMVETLL